MSLKLHIMDAHFDIFKDNVGAYSEEHGERFHQDILDFKNCYQGQCNENMMGNNVWGLIRESTFKSKRVSRKRNKFTIE